MRAPSSFSLSALLALHGASAAPQAEPVGEKRQFGFGLGDPTVVIDSPKATIIGTSRPFINIPNPGPVGTLESFTQIPFAEPPVGPLRLRPPVALDPDQDMGTINATALAAAACPQQIRYAQIQIPNLPTVVEDVIEDFFDSFLASPAAFSGREDCLTLNVQRPGGVKAGDDLPVLLWIFGGGFELGSTAMYDGAHVVEESVALGKPVIFAEMNYRVAGFGFLPGKEILANGSANLGLLDQRLAMEWVSDNIRAFGGDPDKITIWGQSAGSISAFDQIVAKDGDNTYDGKQLFRGAIMSSGSAIPADPVDCPKGQAIYDQVVEKAGCAGEADTLECLRGADYETLLNATNSETFLLSYQSIALSYLPRPDGTFLTVSPDAAISSGKFARVPFIIGDMQDEGTLFAAAANNISTTQEISQFLRQRFFSNPAANIDGLVANYPDDPAAGSPYGTGSEYNFFPQFKRLASLLGDSVFTLVRRGMLNYTTTVAPDVPSWSYLGVFDHGTPYLGTPHGSDLIQVFYGEKDNYAARAIMLYYLNFVYNLDPNNGTGGAQPQPGIGGSPTPSLINWPQWGENHTLVQFDANSFNYTQDDFREEAFEFLVANADYLHF